MTWTKDKFEKLYARFTESGLSIRDFCYNEGIPENQFYYWKAETLDATSEIFISHSHWPEELSLLWQ